MGCYQSRDKSKLDQGTCCDNENEAFSHLFIYILLKDKIAEKLYSKKVIFFRDYLIVIRFNDIVRGTDFCNVTSSGLLFDYNIPFDKNHLSIMEKPLEIEITCNDMFSGKLILSNLKFSIFKLSKEELKLKNERNQELQLEIHYGWTGEYFESIRTLSHELFSRNEQMDIIQTSFQLHQTNYGDLDSRLQTILKGLIGDNDDKLVIYENLISKKNPGPKAFSLIHDLIADYNPYSYCLQHSFKLFMKNIVAYDESFEPYAVNLVQNNIKDYLIYENIETFKMMLKKMFQTQEDPNEYFSKYAEDRHGSSPIFDEIFKSSWLFETLIFPSFEKDPLKTMNVCNILDLFDGFEDYFLTYSQKLTHIDFDQMFLQDNQARILNLIKTPEFHNIHLKILKIYGHGNPTLSAFLGCQDYQSIVNGKRCFSSNLGETKNLMIIAEQVEEKRMFLTHVFLSSPGSSYNSPLIKAMFFISDKIPEEEQIKQFSEMKFEDFLEGKSQKSEDLFYCGMIDLGDNTKTLKHNYKEIHFENIIEGKYLTVLCLETVENGQNMDIGRLGCLGFINQEDSKKYNVKMFKNGKSRIRVQI